MNPERLIGSVYKRREPDGTPFDRVVVRGLISGDPSMGIEDELSVQPVDFGPVVSCTAASLAAGWDLESEGPGYVAEAPKEATHR